MTGESIERGLHTLGYDTFRTGQREAVETLLDEGKLLLVAPTGGGKSLVYQLPALLLPGTTLVISPLIALMHDQVQALEARGVAATFLASTLSADEARSRLRRIAQGAFQLVYVAPERLVLPGFRALLDELACPLVAIDEAHCISEWGHDFRPEYREIGGVLRALEGVRVIACTATATPVVRDEILVELGLGSDTPQLVRGFARPNLVLRVHEVSGAAERRKSVDETLAEALGSTSQAQGAAILYAPTRKGAEREAERLAKQGWRAGVYHAGLDARARDRTQTAFLARELDVVVATNAFGMGIDRADVRAVIHLAPPGSIEAYYQEVGRAGRDGADAYGLLLVGAEDAPRRRHLIERGDLGETVSPEVVQHKWELFLELLRYAQSGSCRHDTILRYFGDEDETLAGCGRCDVCTELGAASGDPEAAQDVVRKALSAVARVRGRFGLRAAVNLLRGQADDRLQRTGLDRTPTFGILKERSDAWLLRLYQRLVTAGLVDFRGEDRPIVMITAEGWAVMKGERESRLLLPPERIEARGASTGRRKRAPAADEVPVAAGDESLFQALRACRQRLAGAAKVPAYVVAQDRTLRDLARIKPRTRAELEDAYGMGPARAKRYGAALLEVIAQETAAS